MPKIDDDLKVHNWLSALTFNVFKYANAGGSVGVVPTDGGIVITLIGVTPQSEGVNPKLLRLIDAPAVPPAPPSETSVKSSEPARP